ncbi:helix-turn-helix domain-containing protein (plasmid) [Rossellomorea sp. AcN35-11]|nr:helix-turn-helix transcriptional regulator [Rossellomorea aquimaris]WJV32083.1 helix-turn-helix domain-containing protein [Rossellomorea sp. AcN35-11]
MNETVGEKIKKLRKLMKVSQKELAQGICTQSEISRIENNRFKPSYFVLMKISERLGVDSDYFMEEDVCDRSDYIKEVKEQLSRSRRDRNYKAIYELVETELENPLFKEGDNRNHLVWNKGLALYHLLDQKEEAIEVLLSCLSDSSLTNLFKELDVNVLNSIGIIFRNEKQPQKALFYMLRAYEITEKVGEVVDNKLILKVYYNLSKIYTDIGENIEESIRLCNKGIKKCTESESFFLLAEFNYQIGRNYLLHLPDKEEGLRYWDKTIMFDELQGKYKLANDIREEKRKWIEEGKIV